MNSPAPLSFTIETTEQKARLTEDAWNSHNPVRVVMAYTPNSRWRNREKFVSVRDAIETIMTRKRQRELDYRLAKEIWTCQSNRILVRFAYE